MMRSISGIGVLVVATLLLTAVALKQSQLTAERARVVELLLVAENARAERDSTRNVALENERVAALLGDSLRMVEKRVMQLVQRGDVLDTATGRERRGAYIIEVAPAPLWGAFVAPARVVADTAVRAAQFNVRQPPYTIAADVAIPRAPDSARMEVRVVLDPVVADIRVSCAPADSVGIRAALISATTPAWATVKFGRVEQAPEVCQRPAKSGGRSFAFSPLAIGVGRVANWGGRSDWALFIGATVTWK